MADIVDRLITRIEFVGIANAIASFRAFSNAFSSLQGPGITTLNRIGAGLSAIAGPLGFIGGIAALQAAEGIGKVSVAFDQMQRQLEVLYGSSTKAQEAFDWIVKFAASTPFTVEQATDAFIRLGTIGINPTLRNLKVFAGTAQMTKRSVEDIAKAVGFGSLGNFARLRYMGITREQVARNAAPGVIPATGRITNQPAATEAILKTLEQKFGSAFDNFANSPGAAISNFQDAIQRLAYTLAGGRTAAEGITNAFKALTYAVNLVTGSILTLRGTGEMVVAGLSSIFAAITKKIYEWLPGGTNANPTGLKAWFEPFKNFWQSFETKAYGNLDYTTQTLRSLGKGVTGNPPKIPGTDINYGGEGGMSQVIREIIGGGFISKIGVAPSELPGIQREFNSRAPRTVRIEGSDGSNLYRTLEEIVNKVNYQAFRMAVP